MGIIRKVQMLKKKKEQFTGLAPLPHIGKGLFCIFLSSNDKINSIGNLYFYSKKIKKKMALSKIYYEKTVFFFFFKVSQLSLVHFYY